MRDGDRTGASQLNPIGVAWTSHTVLRGLEAQASQHSPNETGGVVMGYWVSESVRDGMQVVVTDWIGPGPNAKHRPESFIPDHEYQEEQIARRYAASGRLMTYLGDWHTHPAAPGVMSERDRATMRRIARHGAARVTHPLMIILGHAESWVPRIWVGQHAGRTWGLRAPPAPLRIQLFDTPPPVKAEGGALMPDAPSA